jgi:hypothetical protein
VGAGAGDGQGRRDASGAGPSRSAYDYRRAAREAARESPMCHVLSAFVLRVACIACCLLNNLLLGTTWHLALLACAIYISYIKRVTIKDIAVIYSQRYVLYAGCCVLLQSNAQPSAMLSTEH